MNWKFYFDSVMENTVPFLLAWEAYVFFMLCFFLSIVVRLNRIENKLDRLNGVTPRKGLYSRIVKLWRSV